MDRRIFARWAWVAMLPPMAPFSRAMAQHASDNPVVSAEDAFGLTVGLESTGLYNPGSIRGFNPQTAGNARIDGLYFDFDANNVDRQLGDQRASGLELSLAGQPHNMVLANAVYSLPHLPAWSVDLSVAHFSSVPAAVDNVAYVPQVTFVNPGAPATLRAQLQNVFSAYIWNIGNSPGFLQFAPRTYLVYLTVDL
jgi:hypothetical protein